MITHYLKVALRNLLKYRTHSLISVLCLAVGITFFTLISYFVESINEMERLPRMEERVRIWAMQKSAAEFWDWESVRFLQDQRIAGIDSLVIFSYPDNGEVTLFDQHQNEHPYQVKWKSVSSNYFISQGLPFKEGSQSLNARDEVVVSEEFVRKVLGNQPAIGLTLRLDFVVYQTSLKDFKIVNVVSNPTEDIDIYFHPENFPKKAYNVESFLNGKATLEEINAQLGKIAWPGERITICRALLSSANDFKRTLSTLFIRLVASLILVSGLINFLKFIIQMFYNRQRELGIRRCLGSHWKGMFALLFAEVFWTLSIAFFFSLCLSELSIAVINHYQTLLDEHVSFPMLEVIQMQSQVYIGVLFLCMLVILFPVHKLRKTSIIQPLTKQGSKHLFRYSMIGVQLVISILFVGGVWVTYLFFDQVIGENYQPLSTEEKKQVLSVPVSSQRMRDHWEVILTEIQSLPGYVEHTHLARTSDFGRFPFMTYHKNEKVSRLVLMEHGSANYFEFFHIPMKGKKIDAEGSSQVYVDERFMQELQADGNTGTVRLGNQDYQIAGTYKALFEQRNRGDIDFASSVFLMTNQGKGHCFIRFASGTDMQAVRKEVESLCRKYVPTSLPLEVTPLDKVSDVQIDTIQMMMRCAMLLGFVSLILVILSVFSAISIDTVGRQKEIAIRKINGARSKDIALLFAKPYIVVYLLSFVFAYPVLRLFLIEVTDGINTEVVYRWDWGIGLFIGFALLLFLVTASKIWQIMHINPALIIKKE